MSAEDDIAALRDQVTGLQRRHAGEVAGVQQAEARAAAAREAMAAEFGMSTLEEAAAMLARLDQEVSEAAGEVRRQLERAGGSQ